MLHNSLYIYKLTEIVSVNSPPFNTQLNHLLFLHPIQNNNTTVHPGSMCESPISELII